MERWLSGRKRRRAKALGEQSSRGFESHSLRTSTRASTELSRKSSVLCIIIMENRIPPKLLTDAGLSMFVNTIKLRELPLPVEEVDIKDLLWHFDMPVWEKDGTDDWNLTPWEVIRKEKGSEGHQKRVETADTIHPLVVTRYNSRWVILDGVHRLVRFYMQGEKKVKAKIIPTKFLSFREYQSE